MNSRFLLIALAVALSTALFGVAKTAASWRPVKVALLDPPDATGFMMAGPTISFATRASEREIIFPTPGGGKIYDLQTGKVRAAGKEGLVAGGKGFWKLKGGKAPQLLVRQNDGAERTYALPAADAGELNSMPASIYQESTTVAASAERVEMAISAHYYRWNTASGALERNTNCDMEDGLANQAIARDGESLINADLSQISVISTETGEFTRHNKVPKSSSEGAYISPFGAFSVYDASSGATTPKWRVIETAGARELWSFQLSNWQTDTVALSPDEKLVAIARADRKVWEIHDAKTGAILRELPLVPDANSGAFSPDGALLYSIRNGVLYRQRAR